MIRQWIKRGLVLITALVLASCSGSGMGGEYRHEVDKTDENEIVTIHYSSYLLDSAQASKVYYDAIREFEDLYPNIRIEPDFIQNANYTAGIKIKLLGGEELDVFDTWSPSLFEEFRKLNPNVYLDLTGSPFLDQFLPNTLKPVTIDGRVYGAPEVMHSDGLLYNKTMFDSFGLTVPGTWDEFIALCETLKENGIIPVAMDAEWSTAQFFWGSIMSNNGADEEWTRRLERGDIPLSDEKFVDAIRRHKEIIDRGFVPPNWTQLMHEQSKDLIGQGKAAMIMTGTWSLPSIMERNPNYEIDFMMVPGVERSVPNINIGTYRVINAKTNHPEEAKTFVAFMNSKANQERLAEGAMAVPSVVSARISSQVAVKVAELVTREDAVLYWPHTVSTESLQVKIQEGVNKYLTGQSLEEALTEMQAVIDEARNK
ncbi:ABC transporter substrate-binding protein [Paenibacillus nanensis]|nr:extracellular solute-binding protein [Paenibacillus nanensis]